MIIEMLHLNLGDLLSLNPCQLRGKQASLLVYNLVYNDEIVNLLTT